MALISRVKSILIRWSTCRYQEYSIFSGKIYTFYQDSPPLFYHSHSAYQVTIALWVQFVGPRYTEV